MKGNKEQKTKNNNEEDVKKTIDGEFIFETSENLEVNKTFDDMGLREDLIKGINN